MDWSIGRFQAEMCKFDSLLRVRLSQRQDCYFIERKVRRESACRLTPTPLMNYDTFSRAREGYIHVLTVPRGMLDRRVLLDLRASDMWAFGGAGPYADALEEQERKLEELREGRESNELQDVSGDVYDKLRVMAKGKYRGTDVEINERVFNVGVPESEQSK